jgi:hypothetical protein
MTTTTATNNNGQSDHFAMAAAIMRNQMQHKPNNPNPMLPMAPTTNFMSPYPDLLPSRYDLLYGLNHMEVPRPQFHSLYMHGTSHPMQQHGVVGDNWHKSPASSLQSTPNDSPHSSPNGSTSPMPVTTEYARVALPNEVPLPIKELDGLVGNLIEYDLWQEDLESLQLGAQVEHPSGEHPSRTLFVRNISSNVVSLYLYNS